MVNGWRSIFGNAAQTVVDAIRGTLATALLPGSITAANFLALQGLLDGLSNAAVLPKAFCIAADFLTAGPFLVVPPVAGYIFWPTILKGILNVCTGVATGNWNVSCGDNGPNYNNVTASPIPVSFTPAAFVTSQAAGYPQIGPAFNTNGVSRTAGGIYFRNQLVPTGLTALSGYVFTEGVWIKQ